MSPIGAFPDRSLPPTDEAVRAALGAALPQWDRLCGFVEATYRARAEWAYLGREYGWMRRFRRSGRTILSLIPGGDVVTALVVVPRDAVEGADALGLTASARDALDAAREYAEGRWVYAAVGDESDAASIERLVLLRTPPRARHREAGESRTSA